MTRSQAFLLTGGDLYFCPFGNLMPEGLQPLIMHMVAAVAHINCGIALGAGRAMTMMVSVKFSSLHVAEFTGIYANSTYLGVEPIFSSSINIPATFEKTALTKRIIRKKTVDIF